MNKKKTSSKTTSCYAQAGVDIDQKMNGLKAIKRMVRATKIAGVLNDIGSFGGLFASPGKDTALVASTDGVGTKLKVACLAGRHDTVGQDLVNHCVNDILVQGASPLFFMDYIGTSRFQGKVFQDVVAGLCKACRENHCALLGGETAEMPGLYPPGEYDLVGTIVGVVEKKKIVTGQTVRPGDMIIGLPADGLQTNGYSLARKLVFEKAGLKLEDRFPGTARSVADVLLALHRSFLRPVQKVMKSITIHGMAHITGGGLVDNVPRSLPDDTAAVFDRSTWKVPTVFQWMQETGKVSREEMFRVFNMGIGYVLIVRKQDADKTMAILRQMKYRPILAGYVTKGRKNVILTN